MDVESLCAAAYGECSPERANSRNGYRERSWETRGGSVELKIPKLRKGSGRGSTSHRKEIGGDHGAGVCGTVLGACNRYCT